MEADAKLVLLGLVLQLAQAGEIAFGEDDGARAGGRAEGHVDGSVLVGGVVHLPEPHLRIVHRGVGVVEHADLVASRGVGDQGMQPPLADQCPAVLAVTDEIDHIHAGLVGLGYDGLARRIGQLNGDRCATQRIVRSRNRVLEVGDQTVEVDVGIDLLQVVLVEVDGVDFVHLDQQRRHILGEHFELDRITGQEDRLVGECKVDVHAILDRLESFGGQHGGPFLGIACTECQLHLGQQPVEIRIEDVRLVRLDAVLFCEVVQKVTADERFVLLDNRQQREGRIVGIERRRCLGSGLALQHGPRHVELVAWQLEVCEEAGFVVDTVGPVEHQPVVHQVGLQRVEHRAEAIRQCLHPFEVGLGDGTVAVPVVVGPGLQLREVDVHEVAIGQVVPVQLDEFLKLGNGQQVVDREATERGRMFLREVGMDHRHQSLHIGPGQAAQQLPAVLPRQLLGGKPVECGVLVLAQVAVRVGPTLIRRPVDELLVECRGQAGRVRHAFLGVVEVGAQLVLDVLQALLRVFLVGEQRVPGLDFREAGRLLEAFVPKKRQRFHLLVLGRVEQVQGVVVVVVFRPCDELLQCRRAILRQGEIFDVADVGRLGIRHEKEYSGQPSDHGTENCVEGSFHGRCPFEGECEPGYSTNRRDEPVTRLSRRAVR